MSAATLTAIWNLHIEFLFNCEATLNVVASDDPCNGWHLSDGLVERYFPSGWSRPLCYVLWQDTLIKPCHLCTWVQSSGMKSLRGYGAEGYLSGAIFLPEGCNPPFSWKIPVTRVMITFNIPFFYRWITLEWIQSPHFTDAKVDKNITTKRSVKWSFYKTLSKGILLRRNHLSQREVPDKNWESTQKTNR